MNDTEQLRVSPELLAVMRGSVTHALARGAEFVAPADVLRALLEDPQVGPVLAPLVPSEKLERATAEAEKKLPEVAEIPEGALPDGERPPFVRFDTLAFGSLDGKRTLYLDGDTYHLFIEGSRRAEDMYRPKHLVLGFTAEAVKDRDLLSMFGADISAVSSAVAEL